MSGNEPDEVRPEARPAGPSEAAKAPADRPAMPAALPVIALGAGLLAGLISWGIGEALLHTFRPPLQRTEMMGHVIWKPRYEDKAAADYKNATLAATVLGIVLGAALGYAGGRAAGSDRSGLEAGALAMVLGGTLAGGSSLALLPLYFREEARSQDELARNLALPLVVYSGIAAAAGLAGGVGLGLGLRSGGVGSIKAGLGGAIGGAIGAALTTLLGAMLFTGVGITAPLAMSGYQRLVARLLVATLAGYLAATFAVLDRRTASGPAG